MYKHLLQECFQKYSSNAYKMYLPNLNSISTKIYAEM